MRAVTLVFALHEGRLLLGMKKRGFGAGRYNGFGGKVEPGETIEEAAARECLEEAGIRPLALQPAGRLAFYISDDPDFKGHDMHIFSCAEWEGEPQETDEMRPEWFRTGEIPYGDMWVDDPLWLPLLLAGVPFSGSVTLTKAGQIIQSSIKTEGEPA